MNRPPANEAGTAAVAAHPFTVAHGPRWERCDICRLAEAAHIRANTPYVSTAPHAVADTDNTEDTE